MITVIAALIKMVLESQCMLKMSSGSNAGVLTLPPPVNCIVNDALLHVSPHVNHVASSRSHSGLLSGRHVAALRLRFCSQLGLSLGLSLIHI